MAPSDSLNTPSAGSTADEVDLAGVVLPDARTGEAFDLGAGHRLVVLAVIRHRY